MTQITLRNVPEQVRHKLKLVASLRAAGTPLPTNDIRIAAAAMENGARLVTYDQHCSCIPGLIALSP